MKLLPRMSLFDDAFDRFFDEPLFPRYTASEMKTDIHEKDGNYLLSIELPGYRKEDIQIAMQDGYLNVSAVRNENKEEKDERGNIIRQERYQGSLSRSFYVGDIDEEDVKAKFENGELKISFPSVKPQIEERKKSIMIE